jgi:hypothetical protein
MGFEPLKPINPVYEMRDGMRYITVTANDAFLGPFWKTTNYLREETKRVFNVQTVDELREQIELLCWDRFIEGERDRALGGETMVYFEDRFQNAKRGQIARFNLRDTESVMAQCVMAQLLTWNVVKSKGAKLDYYHDPTGYLNWGSQWSMGPLDDLEFFAGVRTENMCDDEGRMVKKKWEERENMINRDIMAQLETVNKLQYLKYDETGLLEKRDNYGKFFQCTRFPDKNQHVDSGGTDLSGPFLKILLDSFHRSTPSPFNLNFYKFERMKFSGTRKTYLEEDWHPYVDYR